MNTLIKWKNSAVQLAEAHEREVTGILLIVAVVLIAVALFGRAHHKALALSYIVL